MMLVFINQQEIQNVLFSFLPLGGWHPDAKGVYHKKDATLCISNLA